MGCPCLWAQGWHRIGRHQPHNVAATQYLRGGKDAFKGGIFAKDALATVTFAMGDSPSKYTTGIIAVATTIGGEAAAAHGQAAAFSTWQRIADNSAATYASLTSSYPVTMNGDVGFASLASFASSTANDGFLLMTMMDQSGRLGGSGTSGAFDAYVALAPVNAAGVAEPIDVAFWQLYRKSNNDHCYVDYGSDGTNWNAVEINVAGIDIEAGQQHSGMLRTTLPLSCCGQSHLYLRLRWTSTSHNGGVYGYYWAVDDLAVSTGDASRLSVANVNYAEGFYPIMPAGLQTPLAASFVVSNNGSAVQGGVSAFVYTMNDGGGTGNLTAPRQAATSSSTAIPAAPQQHTQLLIDPLALISGGDNWCYFPGHGTATGTLGYLPTDLDSNTTGYYYAWVGNGSLGYVKDTMSYRVSAGGSVPRAREARLWGRDNGVLRSGSAFHWSLDDDGCLTDNGLFSSNSGTDCWHLAGYGVTVSFTTGAAVPEDWVVRGVQLVAATDGNVDTGALVMPILTHDSMDEQYIYTMDIATGASSYTVKAEDITPTNGLDYSTLGHYRTINLILPYQPDLKPMTNYNVGYRLADGARFAVATGTDHYIRQGDGVVVPFSQEEGMEAFATPQPADWHKVRFYDPRHNTWVGAGRAVGVEVPMIRMIVGPKVYITNYGLTVNCGENGFIADEEGNHLCGQVDSLTQGSTNVYYIRGDAGYELNQVTLDGEVLANGDRLIVMRDPDTRARYGMLTLEDVQAPHSLSATFVQKVDIEPVAAAVHVRLQPNPASDIAGIAVSGVQGSVCYSLLDVSGRVLRQGEMTADSTASMQLYGLPRGTYFVRVTGDAFSKVEKLMVR